MQAKIGSLLDETTRRNLVNTINLITRLGNKKPKLVEPRRKKLRDILMANKRIVRLYNVYANAQVATEKRVTFCLPVFGDLELAEETDSPDAADAQLAQEANEDEHIHESEEHHELEREQNDSKQHIHPAQIEDTERQQDNHDAPDTSEGAKVDTPLSPNQDIQQVRGGDLEMQEESHVAIDTGDHGQSGITSSVR
jgi:hypothetical protein